MNICDMCNKEEVLTWKKNPNKILFGFVIKGLKSIDPEDPVSSESIRNV